MRRNRMRPSWHLFQSCALYDSDVTQPISVGAFIGSGKTHDC